MKDDRQRVVDMLEAIGRIRARAPRSRDELQRDEPMQVWVLQHLMIVGEAARAVSDDLKTKHPEVPWVSIVGIRNAIVHEYERVDLDEVWAVVVGDLPPLEARLRAIVAELR